MLANNTQTFSQTDAGKVKEMVCIVQIPLLDSFYILSKSPDTSFNNLILVCKSEKYFLIKHS